MEEKSLLERLRCEGYFLHSFFMYVVRFCSFHGEDGFSMYVVDRFCSFHGEEVVYIVFSCMLIVSLLSMGRKWFRLELLSNNNHTEMDSLFEIYLYLKNTWRIFCRQIFLSFVFNFSSCKAGKDNFFWD